VTDDRCRPEPESRERDGELDCAIWPGCESGRALQLCLHGRDHTIDPAWLDGGLRWALALPAAARGR
jgi:polyhydroxybutyrate depolymerase